MYRRLVAGTVAVVAASLIMLTAAFTFALGVRLRHDADEVLRARADALIATLDTTDGRLAIPETPLEAALDVRTWIYDPAGKNVEKPLTDEHLNSATQQLAGVKRPTYAAGPNNIRLLGVPVVNAGRRLGSVVVGVSELPYQHVERTALLAAVLLDLGVVLLVAFGTRKVAAAALRPVAVMTEQATEWSERDPDRRFGLASRVHELDALAATLDRLLGRLAASVRHERALTADIAHELRTPLARVRTEAELALRHPRSDAELRAVIESVVTNIDQLHRTIDTLLSFAERQIDGEAATCTVGNVIADATQAFPELDVDPLTTVPVSGGVPAGELLIGCSRDQVARMLGPLLDNAAQHRRSVVRIAVGGDAESVALIVTDDGPGVDPAEAESIFRPGVRGATAASQHGTGLGLTLARRLARASGGDITVQGGPGGTFTLRLPRV